MHAEIYSDLRTAPSPALKDRHHRLKLKTGFVALMASVLSACSSGPDYHRPAPPAGAMHEAFKEGAGWKQATPGQADVNEPWWSQYGDPLLDGLVDQAMRANATLEQASAQYRQAQALVPAAKAAALPSIGMAANIANERTVGNSVYVGDVHSWNLLAAWEPDFWGGVGRSVEAAKAGAQASAGDLAAAQLAVQSALVNDYLQLRMDDALAALFDRTVKGYEKALQLTQSMHRAGLGTRSDVDLAEATLQAARAQATDIDLSRRQIEHAIAVLIGKAPVEFSIAPLQEPSAHMLKVPSIPAALPSTLLERRPDVAAAERRVAQANANIGVTKAAWFPNLTLNASYGNSGPTLGQWFAAPFEVWALGAQLAASFYDGGLRSARENQARSAFEVAAASYRQTVLAGLQDVEDNLAALNALEKERAQQEAALQSSRSAEHVLLSQYKAGTSAYPAVITAQAQTLANERAVVQVQSRQLAASVNLIKALGGGWKPTQE